MVGTTQNTQNTNIVYEKQIIPKSDYNEFINGIKNYIIKHNYKIVKFINYDEKTLLIFRDMDRWGCVLKVVINKRKIDEYDLDDDFDIDINELDNYIAMDIGIETNIPTAIVGGYVIVQNAVKDTLFLMYVAKPLMELRKKLVSA